MEKKLIRWKAVEERLKPKGKLIFQVNSVDSQEKEAVTKELRENFGSNFKIEDVNVKSIRGSIEGYHDELMDKMFELGWEW
jgi:hypothetical protein